MQVSDYKPLTADEVTFETKVEYEDIPVRGNYMCTDEPELDKQAEDEVIKRLEQGDMLAWCCVVVTATWEGHSAYDSLGGCSFEKQSDIDECVEMHGMKANALLALNESIKRKTEKILTRF